MHLLSIENLTKHYGDKTLFSDVSFSLSIGTKTAIIGVNGSGKTTLLRMIMSIESADAGDIRRNPKMRFEYLPQNLEMGEDITVLDYVFAGESPTMQLLRAYENAVLALQKDPSNAHYQDELTRLNQKMETENGWAAEANAKAVLTKLGITQFETPLGTLSGGQRRRVALARTLIDPADLLILDEPTNHIDPDTIAWLENYLSNLKTALLMVTHDRYFLDRVVDHILEIESGQIYNHQGNYSTYLTHKVERDSQAEKMALDKQNLLQKELAWLHRTPMARGGKQKARIQRAESLLSEQQWGNNADLNISVASRRTGKKIIELQHLHKQFDTKLIIDDFSYTVNKGARLGIVGPNGVGKSTLLNLIAGRLKPDSGQVITGSTILMGYYDQEGEALDESERVIDNITDVAAVIKTADGNQASAAQMLERFQFSRATQWAYISTLSGGERRRLYLLRTLMMAPNVLLLDEPTNDLDIQTLSILEDYLQSYQGVLIVASHDRYFLDRTVEHIFAFEGNGKIKQYPGNYTAYQAKLTADRRPQTADLKVSPANPKSDKSKSDKPRRLSYKEKQELAALEDNIATMEDEKEELVTKINEAGGDYEQLQVLSTALADLEVALEETMERWAELAELAEG